jgi:hypothetical protein
MASWNCRMNLAEAPGAGSRQLCSSVRSRRLSHSAASLSGADVRRRISSAKPGTPALLSNPARSGPAGGRRCGPAEPAKGSGTWCGLTGPRRFPVAAGGRGDRPPDRQHRRYPARPAGVTPGTGTVARYSATRQPRRYRYMGIPPDRRSGAGQLPSGAGPAPGHPGARRQQ